MPILTRDQILTADDILSEVVPVPEWGGEVRVRGLTGAERDRYEASLIEIQGKRRQLKLHNVRARLVSLAAVDEEGRRLFDDRDVEALGKKSAAALERVASAAQRLSGLTDADVEELAKNSPAGQSEGSTSG